MKSYSSREVISMLEHVDEFWFHCARITGEHAI